MAVKDFTYDHTKVKINLNGLPITDLVDSVTVTTDGDDWTVTEGLNDTVLFSKRSNHLTSLVIFHGLNCSYDYLITVFTRKDYGWV